VRKLMVLAAVVLLGPTAWAKVWVTVYRCDETTPLAVIDPNHTAVYRDIMVGTRLVFVVSSDTGEPWEGALLLSWDDAEYGTLSGRGYTPIKPGTSIRTPNYLGSCLESAGTQAYAVDFTDSTGVGLQFWTGKTPYITGGHAATPGDWFIFDYRAEEIGTVDIGLYNPVVSYVVPIATLSLTHVPSRDFNGDTVVDNRDFALLASHWHTAADVDPNGPDAVFDLNADGRVEVGDLMLFSGYWLERTDCGGSAVDPNNPSAVNP